MRIDEALLWATQQLEGGESPSVDAKVLLAHIINKSQTYLFTWPDKLLNSNEINEFELAVTRRKQGEPVAYIIGKRDFWTLTLFTSPHTLIPRPDTEVLVEQVLACVSSEKDKPLTICDLGTGTGAIALALASELPKSRVVGVDFLQEAVELAQRNAAHNKIKNVQFFQSDWFKQLQGKVFDVLVSNPPYIDEASPYLQQGDVRYEPKSALTSAESGLNDICHIATNAKNYLTPKGLLAFEHGFDQAKRVRELMKALGFEGVKTVQDYSGIDRVTLGFMPAC